MNYDLVLERVRKVYPNGAVGVEEFSLAVEKGEFIALLGPSGCGKTTTLRMIGGFEEPTSGDIILRGRRVNGVPPERRHTNMIFQNYALFPHMNVSGNVEYGLRVKGVPAGERRRRVEEVLQRVGLAGIADRPVDRLSGGQRQRIAIARALAVEPDLLLLDEPLGALDANTRSYMQAELKALQKRLGITFIFVTHSQAEAMAMADRIVVMNQGRVEQVGTPAEIYAAPRTRFVAQFVGKNNLFTGQVAAFRDGWVEVATASGMLQAPAPGSQVPPGTAVAVVVRADVMSVQGGSRDPAPGEMALRGVLVGEEIVGAVFTYSVQLESGQVVRVEQHESLAGRVPELDAPVTIWWQAGESVVLADEQR